MTTHRYHSTARARSALVLLMLSAACGEAALGPDGIAGLSLSSHEGSTTLYVSDTLRLIATPLDFADRPVAGPSVTFTSSAPAVASVDPETGIVIGRGPGTARITATCAGEQASLEVRVRLVPVATVVVTPNEHTLHPRWTLSLVVALADARGQPLLGRPVQFSSSNLNVATVDATGLVTAQGLGTATITVTSEGQSAVTVITVTPAEIFSITISPDVRTMSDGTEQQYHAVAADVRGYTLSDRVIQWASSDPGVAAVSPDGVVSALVPGGAIVTARSGAVMASLPLTVRPHIETIALTLDKDTLRVSQFGLADVVLRDVAGNRLVDRDVFLASSNPGVAAVLSDGSVRGMRVGTAVVTARAEGMTATATVTVIAKVVFVRLTPSSVTLSRESELQLTASVLDERGIELVGRVVMYATSNPLVATVDANGVVRGIGKGEATITATCEGRSGTAQITVP